MKADVRVLGRLVVPLSKAPKKRAAADPRAGSQAKKRPSEPLAGPAGTRKGKQKRAEEEEGEVDELDSDNEDVGTPPSKGKGRGEKGAATSEDEEWQDEEEEEQEQPKKGGARGKTTKGKSKGKGKEEEQEEEQPSGSAALVAANSILQQGSYDIGFRFAGDAAVQEVEKLHCCKLDRSACGRRVLAPHALYVDFRVKDECDHLLSTRTVHCFGDMEGAAVARCYEQHGPNVKDWFLEEGAKISHIRLVEARVLDIYQDLAVSLNKIDLDDVTSAVGILIQAPKSTIKHSQARLITENANKEDYRQVSDEELRLIREGMKVLEKALKDPSFWEPPLPPIADIGMSLRDDDNFSDIFEALESVDEFQADFQLPVDEGYGQLRIKTDIGGDANAKRKRELAEKEQAKKEKEKKPKQKKKA